MLTIVKFHYEGMIHFSKNVPLHFGSHPVTHLIDKRRNTRSEAKNETLIATNSKII